MIEKTPTSCHILIFLYVHLLASATLKKNKVIEDHRRQDIEWFLLVPTNYEVLKPYFDFMT